MTTPPEARLDKAEQESDHVKEIRREFGHVRIKFGGYEGTVDDAIDACPPVRNMIDANGPEMFVEQILKRYMVEEA